VLHADQRNRPHSGRRKRIPAPTTNQPTLMPSKNRPAPRTRWQPCHLPPHQPLIQELTASVRQGNRRSHRWPGRAIELPRSA
jgi:hypothetical protein